MTTFYIFLKLLPCFPTPKHCSESLTRDCQVHFAPGLFAEWGKCYLLLLRTRFCAGQYAQLFFVRASPSISLACVGFAVKWNQGYW